jgi:hypothetical protein
VKGGPKEVTPIMATNWGPSRAPVRGDPAEPQLSELNAARARDARKIQALRDTVSVYRSGAAVLAERVSELRAEVARLTAKSRAELVSRGLNEIAVTITLDEYAPHLARAVVVAELAGGPSPRALEDLQLVVSELTASSVRRWAGSPEAEAVLRLERRGELLHVELRDLTAGPESMVLPADDALTDFGLEIVRRLSARWGIEESASGHRALWADVMDREPPDG